MTNPSSLAEAQRSRQRALAVAAAARLRERWALLNSADLAGSWAALLPGALQVLAASQALAVLQAQVYVAEATGQDGPALNAAAFAGTAADGGGLDTLLALPVITTKRSLAAGLPLDRSLGRGLAQLQMIGRTEVADAGRTATGVGIAVRPRTYGSVRVVHPPACGRCIVLAGRVYRWSDGFQRHPHCDCTMAPLLSPEGRQAPEPRELWDSMTREQQDAAAGSQADAQAIRDGADVAQVINAQRGMYEAAGRKFTAEGTTRRGLAGRQLEAAGAGTTRSAGERVRRVAVPRLRPEQIYREAAGDRAEAIRLLRRFGYITD